MGTLVVATVATAAAAMAEGKVKVAAAMEPRAVATVAMAVGEEDLAAAAMAAADSLTVAAAAAVPPIPVVCSVEAVNSVAATGRKVVEMEETSARTYSRFARISVRPHMGGRRQRLAAPMLA
jgi:hypothetical protein